MTKLEITIDTNEETKQVEIGVCTWDCKTSTPVEKEFIDLIGKGLTEYIANALKEYETEKVDGSPNS